MGWAVKLEIDGIEFGAATIYGLGKVIGFTMDDKETCETLRTKDPRLLDVLAKLPDLIDDISVAMWAGDAPWWDDRQHGGQENYLQELRALCQSSFATPEQKERAAGVIRDIVAKRAAKQEKKKRTRARRSQFQGKRDALALALVERDGYICAHCDEVDSLTIDHIKPLSKGGTDDLDNLRWLCQRCNSKKGDRQ